MKFSYIVCLTGSGATMPFISITKPLIIREIEEYFALDIVFILQCINT